MSDALERATRALRWAAPPPGPPQELTAATVAAVRNRLAGAVPASEFARHQRKRKLMRYIGYGTATVVAIAAGVLWLAGPSAGAKVQKAAAEAATAKSVRIVRKVGPVTEQVTTVQGDTFRIEKPDKWVTIGDMKSRKVLALDLVAKTAQRSDLNDAAERELSRQLAQLRDFLGTYKRDKAQVTQRPGEKLGERETRVYAIEFTLKTPNGNDLTVKRTLWLDKKTDLPVRVRSHEPTGDVDSEFDSWNEEFDAKLFDLKVPAGYREVKE